MPKDIKISLWENASNREQYMPPTIFHDYFDLDKERISPLDFAKIFGVPRRVVVDPLDFNPEAIYVTWIFYVGFVVEDEDGCETAHEYRFKVIHADRKHPNRFTVTSMSDCPGFIAEAFVTHMKEKIMESMVPKSSIIEEAA